MLNISYGSRKEPSELLLEKRLLSLAKRIPAPIKKSMQSLYLKALLNDRKGAIPVSFKGSFPNEYSSIAKLKAKILEGRETVQAKYLYLVAFGKYPSCRICSKPAKGLGDRPESRPTYCCKACRYEGLRIDREASLLQTHGVVNMFASKEFAENRISYLQDKYGGDVTGPTKVPGAREKIEQTSRDRFGVANFAQSDVVKRKRVKTIQKKYGRQYTAPFQLPHVKEAIRLATIERLGVEHNSQSAVIKAKKIATSRRNYGTDYPMQTREVKDTIVATV
jgi:hypothetical protein